MISISPPVIAPTFTGRGGDLAVGADDPHDLLAARVLRSPPRSGTRIRLPRMLARR